MMCRMSIRMLNWVKMRIYKAELGAGDRKTGLGTRDSGFVVQYRVLSRKYFLKLFSLHFSSAKFFDFESKKIIKSLVMLLSSPESRAPDPAS
jgi:hypothetical protein